MKALQPILIFLMVLMLVACNTEQTVPVIDNLDIELAVEPDPPTAGDATLVITVKDADGKPINDASVAVHGDMDHEGMTPVDGESSSGENGMYHVPFEWTMGGGWILEVTVTLPDNAGVATERFELFVDAISKNSIINQDDDDNAEMHHNAMDNTNDPISSINIRYMPENDPALAGDANVVVMLTTADAQPIDNATVSLYADMPTHDMMPVTGECSSSNQGRYTIPLRWTMAGEWQVELTVTLSDTQIITKTYTQQVLMPDNSDNAHSD